MPLACAGTVEETEWQYEGEVGERFAVPRPADDNDAQVEDAEAAVGCPDPASGPFYTALVLASTPGEERCDEAAHQGDFFGGLDHPVDATAEAGTVFTGPQEEKVDEEGVPEGKEEDEEGIETAPGEEV